jgi:hypothetical protein
LSAGESRASICQSLSMRREAFKSHEASIMRWQKVLRWRSMASELRAA